MCDGAKGVVHVGCLAHVRRDSSTMRTKARKKLAVRRRPWRRSPEVYRVEKERELSRDPKEFAAERRRQVEPILAEFRGWLQRRATQVAPETFLGKAVGYTLGQWPKLISLSGPPGDQPTPTRWRRRWPFVVGRKNWLFSGSPRGATASATLFSIIETARANGKEPYWYLRELFDKLPTGHGRPTSSASLRFGSRNPDRIGIGWGSPPSYFTVR